MPENVMPLCHKHHREFHQVGWRFFIDRHPVIETWLRLAGRTDVLGRLNRMHGGME